MEPEAVERVIERHVPDAEANVTRRQGHRNEDHFIATVVSPAFADRSLVDQHQLVHDALDEHLTTDIHALQLETLTPREAGQL